MGENLGETFSHPEINVMHFHIVVENDEVDFFDDAPSSIGMIRVGKSVNDWPDQFLPYFFP